MENKIQFQDVFPIEYKGMIEKYASRLQTILLNYDVVIFMARKAICLYNALLVNDEIKLVTTCRVLSSRVVTFNITSLLKGKRIAIVDDVVVKGKSINYVMDSLKALDIGADVYIMACEKDTEDSKGILPYIVNAPQYLDNEGVNQFSNYITKYIHLSGITYNIDFPIFKIMLSDEEPLHFFEVNRCQNLTDDAMRKIGIYRYVLHLEEQDKKCQKILGLNEDIITKIRFYYKIGSEYITAVPFVLLPKLKNEHLRMVFDRIIGDKYNDLLENSNARLELENKYKLLQYVLSDCLLTSFVEQISLSCIKKSNWNETIIFSRKIENNNCKELLEKNNINFKIVSSTYHSDEEFKDYISIFYDYLLYYKGVSATFTNGFGKTIEDRIVYKEDIAQYFNSQGQELDVLRLSCLLDLMIDKGILVPSIVHCDDECIIREYKLGEIYKLHRQGIELFHYMLYRYYLYCGQIPISRTVLEKLCVLFLKKTAYGKEGLFMPVGRFEDDCFSIGFSKFGPRVSNTSTSYTVQAFSALSEVMKDNHYIYELGEHKVYRILLAPTPTNELWRTTADSFAFYYYELNKSIKGINPIEIVQFNAFVDLLTLLAIGPDKKSRLFSLVAELNFYSSTIDFSHTLPEIVYELDNYIEYYDEKGRIQKKYRGIMDCINSGVWKYRCFIVKDLVRTALREIMKNNRSAYGSLYSIYRDYINFVPTADQNTLYDSFIKECGELLLEIGYAFDRVSLIVHKREGLDGGCKKLEAIHFPGEQQDEQYKKAELNIKDADDNTIIDYLKKLKEHADYLIDKCDLFISQEALRDNQTHDSIFVVYDPKHAIPTSTIDKAFLKTSNNSKYYNNLESCYVLCQEKDLSIRNLLKKYLYYILLNENVLFIKVNLSDEFHGAIIGGSFVAGRFFSQLISSAIDKYYSSSVGCQYMTIDETTIDPVLENQPVLSIAEIHDEDQFKYRVYNVEADRLISELSNDTDMNTLALPNQVLMIQSDCERTKQLVSSFINRNEIIINENGRQINSEHLKNHVELAKQDELKLSIIKQRLSSGGSTLATEEIQAYCRTILQIKTRVLNLYV